VIGAFDKSVLRQPRWIAAIIIGLLLATTFVRLGLWQLDRLTERRAANQLIEDRTAEPPRPLEGIVGQYGTDTAAMIHREAIAKGSFRIDAEFFSIGRTYDSLTGTLVATPFDLDDGSVLIVVRGLVPPGTAGPPANAYQPEAGPMVIEGILQAGEQPTAIGEPTPDGGTLVSLSRLDLEFIDEYVEGDVLPVSMMLDGRSVAYPDESPVPIPPQELTEGSHLGYAVQWFGFALIVIVGVGTLVYRAGTTEPATEADSDRTSLP
jgi:surfeit locus 1 family protein